MRSYQIEKRSDQWSSHETRYSNFLENKKQKVVNLDVGGYKYSTLETTLQQVKNSYFINQVLNQDLDTFIFIDRPGKYFSFILNYLRNVNSPNAEVSLVNSLTPLENIHKLDLAIEAEFYGVILLYYL